jgi:adenylate cyclase class 1
LGRFIDKLLGRNRDGRKETKTPQLVDLPPADLSSSALVDEATLTNIHHTFERYNADKIKFLQDQLPPRKRQVFNLIPFLIHTDACELLGNKDACQMSPHGIFGYEVGPETEVSFKEAFPNKRRPPVRPRASFDPSLPIKSVTLIGSLGSIAQNPKSDFDYWICFDAEVFSRESFVYFQEKLQEIEKWAAALAGAEVHFFALDLKRVRENDFGETGGESSGSAQAKLLKEEFYRSLTLVAGQTPLWWIMPPGVDDQEYARMAEIVTRSHRVDGSRLVDMGNVHTISFGEFYGAAIWQINKTMGSPFKSILKMALLEEYIINHGERGLLCTELKQRLISNEEEIGFLDPYVLMFERAAEYLSEKGRMEDLDLLRRSLYMKTSAGLQLADFRRRDLVRKKQVMVRLVREWGWSYKHVEPLNNFHGWTFRQALRFSQETNAFIRRTYRNVSEAIARQKELTQETGLTISQRDLTVLGRKLYIFYSKRTNKVDSILNVIETPPAIRGLTLQPQRDSEGKKIWTAYRALLSPDGVNSPEGAAAMLRSCEDLAEIMAWLVNNQLLDSNTSINLNPGRGGVVNYCTAPDIQKLTRAMKEFFPQFKHSEVDENELLKPPHIIRMFLVINLEESDRTNAFVSTGLCYQNNWGELFYKGYRDSHDGLKIARDFVKKHFAFDPLAALSHFRTFIPDRHFKKDMVPRLDKFFGLKTVI